LRLILLNSGLTKFTGFLYSRIVLHNMIGGNATLQ
jgi:hypothetical protein